MATIGEQLTTPEVGYRRYDDTDSRISYHGSFSATSDTSDSGMYLSTQHYSSNLNDYYLFKFYGTKFRLIDALHPNRGSDSNVAVSIDGGIVEYFSEYRATAQYQTLVYEKTGLINSVHTIVVTKKHSDGYFCIDAIDIDDTGYLVHPILNQVSSGAEAQIGDCIPIRYTALTSGQVGSISELGTCIANEIPVSGTATPDGLAYLLMIGYDYLGRKMFIPDRNLQTNISWDTLNNGGLTYGNNINISNTKLLLHMDDNTFKDECGHLVNNNGVVLDTNNKIFGNESAYFNNTYLTINNINNSEINIKNEFTIEGYVKIDTSSAVAILGTTNFSTSNGFFIGVGSPGHLFFQQGSIALNSTTSFPRSVWVHIAFTYKNNILYVFENGVLTGTLQIVLSNNFNALYLGYRPDNSWKFIGNMSEINITNIAKWTENFTPPTTPYELEKDAFQEIRLLTGGISNTDIDNEWDKIIVNSDLNGTITAGDNNIWHWSGIYSWTSTTNTAGATYRTVRGNTLVSTNSYLSTSSNCGFRPVILVESDGGSNKFLIKQGDNYYSLKSEFYTDNQFFPLTLTDGESPNDNDFKNNGFDDINDLVKVITSDSVVTIESNSEILDEGNLFRFNIPDNFKDIKKLE